MSIIYSLKRGALLLLLSVGAVGTVWAQELPNLPNREAEVGALLPKTQSPQIVSGRYQIYSDYPDTETLALALKLGELFNFYNRYFNFNPDTLSAKLTVRYFSSKERFDRYLRQVAGRSYDHFVYIDYDDVARNELVIYPTNKDFDRLLAHFSFLQFIGSFVNAPPVWLREGFAIYFESSRYSSVVNMVQFQENIDWLDTLQKIIAQGELINWQEFLSYRATDLQPSDRNYYPQAWGLASFLVDHRERATENLFQKIIEALDSKADEAQNIAALQQTLTSILPLDQLQTKFTAYINSRPSFKNIIEDGIQQYNQQKLVEAEQLFYKALAFKRTSHVPYYYLGLVNYEKGEYQTAEHFYIESLTKTDKDEGIIYYALGLNALAANEITKSRNYLTQAKERAPELAGIVADALQKLELSPSQ